MPQSANASPPSTPSSAGQQTKQEKLIDFCHRNGVRTPSWQVLSDRRGGRTAWSCTVQVQGQHFQARYWYDGQYVNNAKEDAAEVALQRFGLLPTPSGPRPSHYQQQQRAVYGAGASSSGG